MRLLNLLLAAVLVVSLATFSAPRQAIAATPFTDISSSMFRSDIDWAYNKGITAGCSANRFCPKGLVTRGEMASFLDRMFDLPATNSNFFSDDNGSMHQSAINRVAAAGITAGCQPGLFCPNAHVTREQMASFITRAAGLSTGAGRNYFWDDEGSVHASDIDRVAAAGITGGCGSFQYCPKSRVTREEMAAFLHRVVAPGTPPQPWGAVAGFTQRPYTSTSAWNTPIASNPAIDSRSGSLVATIDGPITSDPTQYAYPVYVATSSTPRYNVSCRVYNCTVVSSSGVSTTSRLTNVPIPNGARPSSGSDGSMIIIDPATGTEWDFWQARFDGSSWSVSNGSVYNVRWNGMPTRYGSRGAGVPYLAGLIRPWELAQGRIDHALAFAYPEPAGDGCVWPASKTDGNSSGLPQGARLQLNPSYDDSDFAAWGLDRSGRIIARALQRYGMIVVDNSGSPKLFAEDLTANPRTGFSYSNATTRLTRNTISGIPVSAFRVLELPAGYWSGSGSAPMHGNCYR